jgi:hypothetical protein
MQTIPADLSGHPTNSPAAGLLRRLLFAAISLAAGNAALLLFMLSSGLRDWSVFLLYAIFSVLGWILVGIPIAVAFPAHLLSRVAWPFRLLIGAALGPLALLLVFLVLARIQGRPGEFSLAHTEFYWLLSVIVSAISFLVYASLSRRYFPGDRH